jgi:hypothetical protein
MTDLVETVRQGIRKFEHETACGIIAVETLAVHREVLIKLCDEIDSLRKPWVGLTDAELAEFSDAELGAYDLCLEVEAKLKEKNT